METMMPTSFIPKRPVSSDPIQPQRQSHATGLLSLLATVAVIATALSYGGVRLYHTQLLSQKVKTDQLINEARKGIGTEFLADMKRLDARIEGVKAAIDNHIVVTPIFAALEQTTLRSIQYQSFAYELAPQEGIDAEMVKVTLTGTAKSYSTIALQSDSFTQNSLIRNPVFSGLTVDDKTSVVNFKLVFDVDPAALSYETFVSASGAAVQQTGIPVTSIIQ